MIDVAANRTIADSFAAWLYGSSRIVLLLHDAGRIKSARSLDRVIFELGQAVLRQVGPEIFFEALDALAAAVDRDPQLPAGSAATWFRETPNAVRFLVSARRRRTAKHLKRLRVEVGDLVADQIGAPVLAKDIEQVAR